MSELHLDYPLVSVIVPTYNNEARIEKTLRSIIAQDYPNIEIIVVNDASTDATTDVAQKTLDGCGRDFLIINHEKNRGVSAARNIGIDTARGKYVWFCDGDDLAEKNYVSILCAEAERTGADVVFCGYKHYYEAGNRYAEEPIRLASPLPSADDYVKEWLKGKIVIACVWCYILRKNFLNEKKIRFKEGWHVGEDIEFSLKTLALSSRTSIVKDFLYIYVHHSSQQTAGCGPHAADFQKS